LIFQPRMECSQSCAKKGGCHMKTQVLVLLVGLAILSPTLTFADDTLVTQKQRVATLTTNSDAKRMTPRLNNVHSACAGEYVRCGNAGDEACCAGLSCQSATGTASQCR
jgi:hypothetical protein